MLTITNIISKNKCQWRRQHQGKCTSLSIFMPDVSACSISISARKNSWLIVHKSCRAIVRWVTEILLLEWIMSIRLGYFSLWIPIQWHRSNSLFFLEKSLLKQITCIQGAWIIKLSWLVNENGGKYSLKFCSRVEGFSSLYRIFRWGVPGAMVPFGGYYFIVEKKFAFFQIRKISEMLKNQWKIYNFLKIVRKFCDFLKILLKFSQNFREISRKLSKYGPVRGSGGGAPRRTWRY